MSARLEAANQRLGEAGQAYARAAVRLTEEEWRERFDTERRADDGWRCGACGWATDGDIEDFMCGAGSHGEHLDCAVNSEYVAAYDLYDRLYRESLGQEVAS